MRTVNGTRYVVALTSRSYQGGCFGIDAAETHTGGIAARVDDLDSWVNVRVGAVRATDFNCDGVKDIAIADPEAVVGGDPDAGVVWVVYGGGKGPVQIDQDGCTDLVVGNPAEDIGNAADAARVNVLHGAPGGLGTGKVTNTHFEQGSGTGAIGKSRVEADNRMGHAVATGTTAADEPLLVIGAPGEAIDTDAGAGTVAVFDHTRNGDGRPTPRFGLHQDRDPVSGAAEPSNQFGVS